MEEFERGYRKGLSEAIILSRQPVIYAASELSGRHVHSITVKGNTLIDSCEYCRGIVDMVAKITELITPEYIKQMTIARQSPAGLRRRNDE